MTFDDAQKIFTGGDSAATQYFKDHTTDQLKVAFRPPVKTAMESTGVDQKYKAMLGKMPSLPFGGASQSFDLNDMWWAKRSTVCSSCWRRKRRRSGPIQRRK